jgi:16S rRNA (guanine(966)-N(2))-methyltransferase RsmD
MGCEALQRGAREVVAVDQDRRMAATARANLALVAGSQTPPVQITVVQQELVRWLVQSSAGEGFDLIYADPPYGAGLYGPMAEALAAGQWLKPGGRLLMECSSTAIPLIPEPWTVQQQRRYGSSTVLLLTAA